MLTKNDTWCKVGQTPTMHDPFRFEILNYTQFLNLVSFYGIIIQT